MLPFNSIELMQKIQFNLTVATSYQSKQPIRNTKIWKIIGPTHFIACQKCLVEKLLSPQSIKDINTHAEIILVLLLLCTGGIFGTSEGQNLATIESFNSRMAQYKMHCSKIEKQSGLILYTNVNELDVNKSVNINLK